MKTKSFLPVLNLLVAVFLVTFLSGCDKDLVDLNNSPNAISTGSLKTIQGQQALIVGIQSVVGDWYSGDRSRFLSIWTRQMCAAPGLGRPQPVSWNTYLLERAPDSPNDYIWKMAFDVVKLSNDVSDNISSAGLSAEGQNLYIGMAKFYKALALGELAAMYGSIPIETKVLQPTFVSQSAAYAEVQRLLSEAITHFQGGTATDARDLNFSGDATLWIAACNSLKARYYMHTLNYASALTSANAGITASAGTVNGIWSTAVTEYSPWSHWVNTEVGNPIRANKYYTDLLTSEAGDTRLATFFNPGEDTTVIFGFDVYGDLGATAGALNSNRAARINKYAAVDASFPLISYEENVLIRAEATARTSGVAAAIPDINLIRTNAGLTALTTGAVMTNADTCITEILKQKYIQLFLEGQNYHDMRRVAHTDAGRTYYRAGIPPRLLYPEAETKTNPNVPADNASTVNELW
jgi:hypothetical protein